MSISARGIGTNKGSKGDGEFTRKRGRMSRGCLVSRAEQCGTERRRWSCNPEMKVVQESLKTCVGICLLILGAMESYWSVFKVWELVSFTLCCGKLIGEHRVGRPLGKVLQFTGWRFQWQLSRGKWINSRNTEKIKLPGIVGIVQLSLRVQIQGN